MRQVRNLNYKWAFSKDAGEIPKAIPANWYWVNLPHSWNNIDGQDGGNDYYRGILYFRSYAYRQRKYHFSDEGTDHSEL